MWCLAVIIAIWLNIFHPACATIRPSTELSITNGEGFVAFLEVGKSFGDISHCWFAFGDGEYVEIALNSNAPIITERGEQIYPFAKSICGVRVLKVSTASAGKWKLKAINAHEELTDGVILLSIFTAPKTNFDTRVTKPLGKGLISCTKQENTKYCKLINPITGDTWSQCDIYTTIHNGSRYECRSMLWGSMKESIETINVEAASSTQYSEASVEETDDHYVLRCKMHSTSLHTCRAEMPDRKTQLFIMEGLSNGRYSSYDTLSSQSKCALEIRKPLEQNEIGLWKIQHSDVSQLTGCLFYIGQSKETIIEQELKRIDDEDSTTPANGRLRHRIELYSSENKIPEITCAAPFVVDDCYLKDPENTIYFPASAEFERSRALGICTFLNVPSMGGIWSCGLHGSDYKNDVVLDIEVAMESKLGRVLTEEIRVARRDSLELMCKSPFGEPISKCAYIDPLNQVHLLASGNIVRTSGRVQYFGDGIEKGFCGVRIDQVDVDDFGDWSCRFQMYSNAETISKFTMNVNRIVISHATSYGLAFGLPPAILVILFAMFVAYKKRRRAISPTPSENIDMAVLD